jgi:NAD(P)-dependent dehydrogenase (short-subunit alcohol dehydrogenase family)
MACSVFCLSHSYLLILGLRARCAQTSLAGVGNTVVLITGASSGFGLECAHHLLSRGFRVFGGARRFPNADLPFETLHLDVCDDASVERCVADVIDRAGRLDALVNVAGVSLSGALEMHSTAEATAILETNTLGTFRMCRAVLDHMRARGAGRIINVSSLAGRVAIPFASLYSASKFAVEGMTESFRLEVRRFGVHVSLLEPGDFLTPMTQRYLLTRASATDSVYRPDAERTIAIMEADSRSCPDLRPVARRVEMILRSKRPSLRYTTGMPLQRFAVLLHRFIPNSWFESILRQVYQLT